MNPAAGRQARRRSITSWRLNARSWRVSEEALSAARRSEATMSA